MSATDSRETAAAYSIRPAQTADAERMAAIYAHYVTNSFATFDEETMTAHQWAERLAALTGTGHPVLVAVDAAGVVVGYAYAAPWKPKHAYRPTVENSIYIDESAHRAGLGRRLLDALVAACRSAGHTQMIAVISDVGSDASLALHERAGFRSVGRLENVGCKFGTWLGVHLLQRTLT